MAVIRLQEVTKIYSKPLSTLPFRARRGPKRGDRAFSERVAAQAEQADDQHANPDGSVIALDQVTFTIPVGQTLAVVGPSGCGKSTMLRIIAGLEPDYKGQVFYDDQEMRDVPPKERYIGMVFQNYALYPHFEGEGNLSFSFKMRKAPDAEADERIRVTSEIMGIGFKELLRRKPGTLSGGQQQRVAIARAIVRNPRLFLFDEPLSSLDAKLRSQTRIEIKRLLRRFQITSIYVTHDQTEAMALGDQIVIMRAGRIEQMGSYQDLRQHPANIFVAEFLGNPSMNLFAGGTIGEDGLHLEGMIIPLPEPIKGQVRNGQAVTLGIRPEAARLVSADQPLPDGFRLPGVVDVVEPDFARRTQIVYLRTGGFTFAATGELDLSLRPGAEMTVFFPTEHLYFFDSENEERIR